MSTFKTYKIPPKDPEKVAKGQYICNARMRLAGSVEKYCLEHVNTDTRCSVHNIGEKLRVAREEARLSRIVDLASVAERVAELENDKRNLTRLDELILNSLATIQELEKRFPLATVTPGEAVTIAKLREKHAALVHQRIDLETKLKTLLDTDFIFEKAAELFEKNVTDKNTQKILLEGIGKMLNDIEASGNAKAPTTGK